jgi:hypothetical protein
MYRTRHSGIPARPALMASGARARPMDLGHRRTPSAEIARLPTPRPQQISDEQANIVITPLNGGSTLAATLVVAMPRVPFARLELRQRSSRRRMPNEINPAAADGFSKSLFLRCYEAAEAVRVEGNNNERMSLDGRHRDQLAPRNRSGVSRYRSYRGASCRTRHLAVNRSGSAAPHQRSTTRRPDRPPEEREP